MTDPKRLSANEVLDDLIAAFVRNDDSFEFDLKSLALKIKIDGPKWKGVVDKPVAKFVYELEQNIAREFRKLGLELPDDPHGFLALRVKEGSMDGFFEWATSANFAKMKPALQITFLCLFLVGVGLFNAESIVEALNEPKIEAIRAQMIKDASAANEPASAPEIIDAMAKSNAELVKALKANEVDLARIQTDAQVDLVENIGQITNNTLQHQAPLRSLVRSMDEEDVIELPGSDTALTKQQASDKLDRHHRSAAQGCDIDQKFVILTIDIETEPWKVKLRSGLDTTFIAELILEPAESKKFLAGLTDAKLNEKLFKAELQVSATVSSRSIRNARITAIGPAREGAKQLSSIYTGN